MTNSPTLPFTREEMLGELKELVYAFARSSSFVLDASAGYRVLNQPAPADPVAILEPESNADDGTVQFDLGRTLVASTFNQFYDYGICGVCNLDLGMLTGATEWSFAYAFAVDVSASILVEESRNGESVDAPKCLTAARATIARCVLDGGARFFSPRGEEIPDGMLTLAEVAFLAGLDERTIRNATNKNASNRLGTAFVNSSLFIPREAALSWLQSKRGFRPTRTGPGQSGESELDRGFVSLRDAGQFVLERREQLKLSASTLLTEVSGLTQESLRQLQEGAALPDQDVLERLGETLDLPPKRFALRMQEANAKDALTRIQLEITADQASE